MNSPSRPPKAHQWEPPSGGDSRTSFRILAGTLCALFLGSALSAASPASPKPVIALQPLGPVEQAVVSEARAGLLALFDVEVLVLPQRALPESAYYEPRARYRAEKLLGFLTELSVGLPSPRPDKIVGLTQKDISTTKEPYEDWGIFGLGSLGGPTCVVSTYRLKRGNVSRELFLRRLVKVVNHEVGHTFGLEHCPTTGCLMEDAAGTIQTVDRETGDLCPSCRLLLGRLVKASPPSSPRQAVP